MTQSLKIAVIPFEQPVGSFLLGVMNGMDIIRYSKANPRYYDAGTLDTKGGIQRQLSRQRVNEISEYSKTVDATFPTPILLALAGKDYSLENNELIITKEYSADIVDGQHRVRGLEQSGIADQFSLPVVFIIDATEEQKALIFATINGEQTKVPASIIYDLFEVFKTRSPQKTAHEIARALNSTEKSPWYKRLKMLGKKTPGSLESLSQGTFVKFLLPHISDNPEQDRNCILENEKLPERPDCIFNEYWRKEKDEIILKILMNLFNAAKKTWLEEWESPDKYVLTKTNGYTGIMKALPDLYVKGRSKNDLSVDYFESIFKEARKKMNQDKIELTIDYFKPSAAGETAFKKILIEALGKIG